MRRRSIGIVLFIAVLVGAQTLVSTNIAGQRIAGGLAGADATAPATDSPILTSIANSVEATDPATVVTVIRQGDRDRIADAGFVIPATEEDEAAARAALPCQNIAYHNGVAPGGVRYSLGFGGDSPVDNCFDDCTLPVGSPYTFICAAQVRTFGAQNGGAATYDLKVQVWSECPEDASAVIISEGVFLGIPNDGVERIQTITIDPPYLDGDGTFYVGVTSDNPAASWMIAGSAADPGDLGSTSNTYVVNDGQPGCEFYSIGGLYAGFPITLFGTSGALGSCCNLDSGVCTDGVLQSDCADPTSRLWSQLPCSQRTDCAQFPPCTIGQAPNLENEPDCFTNYTDTTNRGCQNLTFKALATYWTPITCGQSGCGRSGTYTFLNNFTVNGAPVSVQENRRDDDAYLLSLTQDSRVTWVVRGKFPSQAIISFTKLQTNGTAPVLNCPTYYSTAIGDNSIVSATTSQNAIATACLPGRSGPEGPFRYLLRARPSAAKLAETALCGLPYTYSLSCEPCSLPTGACCTEQGCVILSRLACLIVTGGDGLYYHGDTSNCAGAGCASIPSNDTCATAINLTGGLACSSCVIPFDTSFAHSEGVSIGMGGEVFRDIWYQYTVPQPGGCASGRLTVSTIGSCFNTKAQILRMAAGCTDTCTGAYAGNGRTTLFQLILIAGPPRVNVGPFVYGITVTNAVPGQCFKFRVGGLTEYDLGPGTLRADFICTTPQSGFAWSTQTGRCCFPNGSCLIAPYDQTNGPTPTCCASLGGYLRNQTNFREGVPPSSSGAEIPGVGCSTLPCPAPGEACFNALDLNADLGGSVGSTSRLTKNRLYYKYTVPPGAVPGSGLVIQTCGSDFDTALAVYRGFNLTTGECHNEGSPAASQGQGTQACANTAFDNSEIVRAADCGPTDAASSGARDRATCYGPGESTACTCVRIIPAGQTPLAGEVAQGGTIWIGIGLKNTLSGSPRPFIDPVRADDCAGPKRVSLAISNPASCFTCSVTCPPGATPENEPLPTPSCTNYVDTFNAGCTATSYSNVHFTPISCGQTYCGTSATYRTGPSCAGGCFAPNVCVDGICVGPADDARDVDMYRIQVTTAQRLTWTVTASFAATIQIIASPSNSCLDQTVLAAGVGLTPCATQSAHADVCPGWYYLLVQPTVLGNVPCGSLYYASLVCENPATAACCKGDANNDGAVNGTDIAVWLNQLAAPVGQSAILLDPVAGCLDSKTCAADFNGDMAVDLFDLPGFVAALLSPNPCGSTVCEDASACHAAFAGDGGAVSDMSNSAYGAPFRCADDFKVTQGQSLTKLCWWGFYFNYNNGFYCSPAGGDSPDSFLVTVYSDAAGVPGSVVAGPVAPINLVKTDTGVDLSYLSRSVRRFKYEADLSSAIPVTVGACYWLEIVNHTTGNCLWLWETSVGGNGLAAEKAGGPAGAMNWHSFDLAENDFAFCFPGVRIDTSDCGLPMGRCCVYPQGSAFGTCSVATRPVCEHLLGGKWSLNTDCSGPCPVVQTSGGCPGSPTQSVGPDVVVADITGPMNFSSSGTVEAMTFGADACNVGDQPVVWLACPNNTHPVFGGNLYKWQTVGGATRFEQVGQSWLKNGFGADQAPTCCTNCIPYPDDTHLGLGCSDAYVASQMAQQSSLSPKYIVNAHTGFYPTGCTVHPSGANAGYLQVDMADLVSTLGGAGAAVRYFCQFQYLTADDALAHNQNNNASSREMVVSGFPLIWDFFFAAGSATQFEIPAIRLWKGIDSGVVETDIDTPEDDGFPGLVIMAAKATDLGNGFWRYEYAINNLNSDRSIGSFSVPCSAAATVQNIAFHDVAYRDGDGIGGVNFDGTDWPGAFAGGAVTWATTPFATNNNANAIRWGTMYNFRFDANRPPAPGGGTVTLGEFKVVTNVTTSTVVPVP